MAALRTGTRIVGPPPRPGAVAAWQRPVRSLRLGPPTTIVGHRAYSGRGRSGQARELGRPAPSARSTEPAAQLAPTTPILLVGPDGRRVPGDRTFADAETMAQRNGLVLRIIRPRNAGDPPVVRLETAPLPASAKATSSRLSPVRPSSSPAQEADRSVPAPAARPTRAWSAGAQPADVSAPMARAQPAPAAAGRPPPPPPRRTPRVRTAAKIIRMTAAISKRDLSRKIFSAMNFLSKQLTVCVEISPVRGQLPTGMHQRQLMETYVRRRLRGVGRSRCLATSPDALTAAAAFAHLSSALPSEHAFVLRARPPDGAVVQ